MSRSGGGPVALDAMGGDHAPTVTVAGALRAKAQFGIEVILVGRPGAVAAALRTAGAPGELRIVAADQVVAMDEDAAPAMRARPDASVRVAARLVAQGQACALLSAGSTGATLTAALLELGRLPGVRRPVLAAAIPAVAAGAAGRDAVREVVLVDAGGSPDVQPEALPAYARMGAAYAQARGSDEPRVGLLNVGAEPGKGSGLVRTAFGLLRDVRGFVGNVEPHAVLAGHVDVVVTDGFTGNVFLKTVEAAWAHAADGHRSAGAAVLLGIAGEVLVAHGAADERQVAAALRTAARVGEARLSRLVGERLTIGDR